MADGVSLHDSKEVETAANGSFRGCFDGALLSEMCRVGQGRILSTGANQATDRTLCRRQCIAFETRA